MERTPNPRRSITSSLVIDPAFERAMFLVSADCMELQAVLPRAIATDEPRWVW